MPKKYPIVGIPGRGFTGKYENNGNYGNNGNYWNNGSDGIVPIVPIIPIAPIAAGQRVPGWADAQRTSSARMGRRVSPLAVIEYSTFGGTHG